MNNTAYDNKDDLKESSSLDNINEQNMESLDRLGDMAAQIFTDDQSNLEAESDSVFLDRAIDIVIEAQMASTTLLQRSLKIGYARAARLIDEMEAKGIVGPFDGAKPRKVLMTHAQWESIKNGDSNSTSVLNDSKVDKSAASDVDVPLRDFTQFDVINGSVSVYENEIHITKKVMTRYGSGTTTLSFTGDSFLKVNYKKPRFFSNGFFEFEFKNGAGLVNNNPDLVDVNHSNVVDFSKMEFNKAQDKLVHLFLVQLIEDTQVPLKEI